MTDVTDAPGSPEAAVAADDPALGNVLQTPRLDIRRVTQADAPFIFRLLNDPAWLRFIGDKGVRTIDDARRYIVNGPIAMYQRTGFGLYLVALRESGVPIGLCGLIRREGLDDVDIGFAFLPEFHRHGYGHESAAAVMELGKTVFKLGRIVAITSPENLASIRLIERLGLRLERSVVLPGDGGQVSLYA